MSSYPKGDYTIIEDEIVVKEKNINQTFDQLLNGLQNNRYRTGLSSEIVVIEKPNYIKMNMYDWIGEWGIDKYTSVLEATLSEKEDTVIVRIHIYEVEPINSRIISDEDIYTPIILQNISIDLTGSIDPSLIKRLFPQKHIDIVKFEDKLVMFFLAFIIVSYIFVEIPYYWYIVFGSIGIYAIYYLIDLLRN